MTNTTHAIPGAAQQIFATNVHNLLRRKDMCIAFLADRIGWERSVLSKHLNDHRQTWPLAKLDAIARVLGTTLPELFSAEGPREPASGWNPRYDDPQIYVNAFTEHQRSVPTALTFNRMLCSHTFTESVLENHHESLFTGLGREGQRLNKTFTAVSRMRAQQFRDGFYEETPQIVSLMLRSDFEKLIQRQHPYEFCTPQDVLEQLDQLCGASVHRWRFRLLLIDDHLLNRSRSLRLSLQGRDSLTVVGTTLAMSRLADYSVTWSDRLRDVDAYRKTLLRLQRYAGFEGRTPSAADVFEIIDPYRKKVEKEIKRN